MPFLLAKILNFQGSTHHIGVGSFSFLFFYVFLIFENYFITQNIFIWNFHVFYANFFHFFTMEYFHVFSEQVLPACF